LCEFCGSAEKFKARSDVSILAYPDRVRCPIRREINGLIQVIIISSGPVIIVNNRNTSAKLLIFITLKHIAVDALAESIPTGCLTREEGFENLDIEGNGVGEILIDPMLNGSIRKVPEGVVNLN
jgi:hypothetical protein